VFALDEPFRTVVLLRFFDDLAPRAIARQLGVPLATVHSRLQRGLARLRERLDRRPGCERRAWVAMLLSFLSPPSSPSPLPLPAPILGALVMHAKTVSLTLVALVLCVVALRWLSPALTGARDDPNPGVEPSREPTRAADVRGADVEQDLAPDEGRVPLRIVEGPQEHAAVVAPGALLRGRVLDAEALPLAGISIAFAPEGARADERRETLAVSAARGVFEVAAPREAGSLVALGERYVTVMAGAFRPGSSIEPVIVVAPRVSLAGRVFDDEGRPLAEARVGLRLDESFAVRFAHVLDASVPAACVAVSDARGAFELPAAFFAEGTRLVTTCEGFVSDVRDTQGLADRALEIVLHRREFRAHVLRGDVRGPDGLAVEGARVAFGLETLATGPEGTFEFELGDRALGDGGGITPRALTAVKRGFLPATFSPEADGSARWPDFVRLHLGERAQELGGRVCDEHGAPLAGIRVWLAEPTFLGLVDGSPTHVESLAAGAPSRAEFERMLAQAPSGTDARTLLERTPTQRWYWAETDAHGRFHLAGLLAQPYRLKALDPVGLVQIEAGPFAAGRADVELTLPLADCIPRLTGHVLSLGGRPLAGVRVRLTRTVLSVQYPSEGGTSTSSHSVDGASCVSDAEGSYELERVPREGVSLVFEADAIVATSHELTRDDDAHALDVRVRARCHLQVELGPPIERADRFRVLDADGHAMPLAIIRGGDADSQDSQPLSAGRSAVFAIAEGARTVVLLREGQEVARAPIDITPEGLNVIRP